MGLDIHLCVASDESDDEVDEGEPVIDLEHGLSRDFCTLMCRPDAIAEEPELDQIGRLTGVDVDTLYRMEELSEELRGNIDEVIATLEGLISKLSLIRDLPQRLSRSQNIRLDVDRYFSNFDENPGGGYIGNNFGQDLRNLQHQLAQAKTRGATTVYFEYG